MAAPLGLFGALEVPPDVVAESVRLRGLSELKRPDWTEFQNRLRNWLESRLPADISTLEAALPTLEARLTSELSRAGMLASSHDVAGYVSVLKVSRPAEHPNTVIIESGISVGCGSDVSFDLYRFSSNSWERVLDAHGTAEWGNELLENRFSAPDPVGNRVLYLSWFGVQCGSAWDVLEYRVVRLSPEADRAEAVLSGTHSYVIGGDMNVKITPDELLLEVEAEAMEGGYHRTHVLHYPISGEDNARIDPVALQPQDFVHEWLIQPWSEMQSRSSASVEKWHKFLHADWGFGEYGFVQPCEERKGVTQISVGISNIADREIPEPLEVYFLVEDKGDYRFEMSEVSFVRQPGCPGETSADYNHRPSLFKK